MSQQSLERLSVYDPEFTNHRVLDVSQLTVSWAISEVGRLQATAPSRKVLEATDAAPSILGRWIVYNHPTGGYWSGYVEDANANLETGVTTLSCVSLVNLLQYRRTPIKTQEQQMSAGGLVMQAIRDSAQDDQIWLSQVMIDDSETLLSYQSDGDSVLDVMDSLVNESGEEWLASVNSDGTQILQWRQRVGKPTVVAQFAEGVGVLGGTVQQSISRLINDLLAVSENDQYTGITDTLVTDRVSILAYGRRQQTRRYLSITSPASLRSASTRDLATSAAPTKLITLQIPHLDSRLDVVREGSRVAVSLASVNGLFRCRVIGRSYVMNNGTCTLLLETESEYDHPSLYLIGAGSATTGGL